MMSTVHEGLQSSDAQLSAMCATTIDHLATFYFENSGKDKVEMQMLNKVGRSWFNNTNTSVFFVSTHS